MTRSFRSLLRRGAPLPLVLSSFVALCLCCVARVQAENWPGWRGADRTGVSREKTVPLRWSPQDNVKWKVPLAGSGISSPVIWRDRVILTASEGPTQSDLHIVCLSLDDGRQLWHLKLWGTAPTRHHATKSSMASATPVTDGRHVYAFFGTGDVFCVDMDGGLVWHRSLAAEYGNFENRFAASSSPLLFGDLLLLQCDHYGESYLLAIDTKTGADRWKTDRPEAWLSWSSPLLAPVGEGPERELIVSGSEKIDAFDPRSGTRLWTVRGMAHECIPTPVWGNGLLYAVSGPNGQTLAIQPGGRGDVTDTHVVWSNGRGTPFVPSAILVGDFYYMVDDKGIATCLDAHTGRPAWQKRLGGNYTASPVATQNRIYLVNEAGRTVVVRAGLRKYVELARNELNEPVFASPSISQGHLFMRTARHLYCIGQGVEPAETR